MHTVKYLIITLLADTAPTYSIQRILICFQQVEICSLKYDSIVSSITLYLMATPNKVNWLAPHSMHIKKF